ncbi:thiamine-phosphate synthase family protein, partial [Thermococcus sp.]|uniref:thiamine-phosphate synthase family protein n=1 Tax=Thermococcus sp. TaxID=35749 RepID=UPI0025DFADA0
LTEYMPEEGVDFIYALPRLYSEVATVTNRGEVDFGASGKLPAHLLEIMEHFPGLRSAISLRCNRELIGRALGEGFAVLEYGEAYREKPDLVCMEFTLLVLGKNPQEVLEKVKRMI